MKTGFALVDQWLEEASPAALLEGVVWYQRDAAYCYREAREAAETGAFAADRIQQAAAHSAMLARVTYERYLALSK